MMTNAEPSGQKGKLPEAKDNDKGLEDLLDNSLDGGIIEGAEENMDFNPMEDDINAHAAATGFDKDFTETVVIKDSIKVQ